MYETINEPIDVICVFKKGTLLEPKRFRWKEHQYQIRAINLSYRANEGSTACYYFDVSDEANYFKLSFNTRTLQWRLEELYSE